MRERLEIVMPVHNEQLVLAENVRLLHAHAREALPQLDVTITIADNASTDLTSALALTLADELPDVRLVQLTQKGRGRALRTAWSASDADYVAYMDVDLSTDLAALAPLMRPLLSGEADLSIGSRLARGADVERSLKREVISRSYNGLLRTSLGVCFEDAQCGFKAARRTALLPLLGRIENQNWFFDTELLYLAESEGLRIFELPVRWIEDRESSVKIIPTAVENLRAISRLRRREAGKEGVTQRCSPSPRRVRRGGARPRGPRGPQTPDHQGAGAGRAPC